MMIQRVRGVELNSPAAQQNAVLRNFPQYPVTSDGRHQYNSRWACGRRPKFDPNEYPL